MAAAAEVVQERRSGCWCCDGEFPEAQLVRLGSHPEVAVCLRCARFLQRQAQARADEESPSIAGRARDLARAARAHVVSRGWHRWAVIGRVLRWFG